MKHLIRVAELAACLLPFVLQPARAAAPPLTEQAAHAIGVDTYLYFYPLVTMDITRKQSTNIEAGKEFGKGPMNVFTNVPAYPPADLKVVARINFDTLYSIAWLDLTKEPQIVSVPDTAGRFYSCRCSTCGRTSSRRRAGERRAHRRPTSSSRRPVGRGAVPEGIRAHRRADVLCLDHRPHQDGRPGRLRCGAQDTGRLQGHATLRLGQAARSR